MTGINEIREAFSKGGIVLKNGNCVVIYTFNDRWVTQSLSNRSKEIFYNLIENCDRLSIQLKKGNSIRYEFEMDENGDDSIIFYAPIKNELTTEELEQICRDIRPSEEFLNFIDGTIDNDDVFREKLAEWTEIVMDKKKPKIRNVETLRGFPKILELCNKLVKALSAEMIIERPDEYSDGFIEIQIPEIFTRKIIIYGKNKDFFADAVSLSECVDLEMNVNGGYINIYFYP